MDANDDPDTLNKIFLVIRSVLRIHTNSSGFIQVFLLTLKKQGLSLKELQQHLVELSDQKLKVFVELLMPLLQSRSRMDDHFDFKSPNGRILDSEQIVREKLNNALVAHLLFYKIYKVWNPAQLAGELHTDNISNGTKLQKQLIYKPTIYLRRENARRTTQP